MSKAKARKARDLSIDRFSNSPITKGEKCSMNRLKLANFIILACFSIVQPALAKDVDLIVSCVAGLNFAAEKVSNNEELNPKYLKKLSGDLFTKYLLMESADDLPDLEVVATFKNKLSGKATLRDLKNCYIYGLSVHEIRLIQNLVTHELKDPYEVLVTCQAGILSNVPYISQAFGHNISKVIISGLSSRFTEMTNVLHQFYKPKLLKETDIVQLAYHKIEISQRGQSVDYTSPNTKFIDACTVIHLPLKRALEGKPF